MHVISNLEIGGGQEVVRTLVESLVEIGCAPVVCAFVDGPLRCDIERLGIPRRDSARPALQRHRPAVLRGGDAVPRGAPCCT